MRTVYLPLKELARLGVGVLEGLRQIECLCIDDIDQVIGDRDWERYRYLFERAQRKMERRHYISRVDLMVHEKHRMEVLKDLGADPYVD